MLEILKTKPNKQQKQTNEWEIQSPKCRCLAQAELPYSILFGFQFLAHILPPEVHISPLCQGD